MNTRGRPRPPAMTPEESRLLDSALPPEDAKRLARQIAADPERSDALEAYKEAMSLWREDAGRTGPAPEAMADQVLAALDQGEAGGSASIPTWYAVAAMLLISVGVIGTASIKQRTPKTVLPKTSSISATILETLVEDQMMSRSLTLEGAPRAGGR